MTDARANYEKVNNEYSDIIIQINNLDDQINDLDVNHFRDADYAEKLAAMRARRQELVDKTHEVGARLDEAKKALREAFPQCFQVRRILKSAKK